ncbi:Sulfotransferase family protein [Thiohalospira halophila DSM 15071]|uniref:Sulfotransferase family protein n=1 Tax=Thiohalospira halophila DSM 15071 TaxID=1123397 RepID=A0A1I1NFU4_9GAMM|nr:sulfotransferase [Thiohalospira halophila]SFC96499.1 Sulfotransferase family protein [Thiohalospira halophila DSM 15071]
MEKPVLVLIRGLGHSGTTILDMALSSHPKIAGVGEGFRVLCGGDGGPQRARSKTRRHEQECSCGDNAATCELWGELMNWLEANDSLPFPDKLNKLVDQFGFVNSDKEFLVDSSQSNVDGINELTPDFEVRAIFLVRDFRSWVFSRISKTGDGVLRCMWNWYRGNKKIEKKLVDSGVSFMLVGYEEFALYPEKVLKKVCDHLGVGFDEKMLCPAKHNESHALVGNRVRLRAGELERVKYDGSWLASSSVFDSVPFINFFLKKLNTRWVYSNDVLVRR